jgi:dTDP-4-amino-4,6-dideoxygalactose transaminase
MDIKIPLFKIYWDEEDVKAVTDSIKRGMMWAAGPNVEKFEKAIADYLGRKYCVVFNSGTTALHSALVAYGIGQGDEVIVPSFTFIATSNAVLLAGARPIFVDIDEENYGLDPEDIRKKITPKTKAIIPVHYGGGVCKIDEIQKIAKEHNLLLIEDAAESFGSARNGKKVGTFGDAAMFSFCQTKVFTTGEGGCIVTDDEVLSEKIRLIRGHGRKETVNFCITGEYMDYIALGSNYRMPDMIAALGLSQIKKLDGLIKIRREKAAKFNELLAGIQGIIIPQVPSDVFHTFQEYPIRIKSGAKARDALKEYLAQKGIGTRISFYPIHWTPFYKSLGYDMKLEKTELLYSQALTIPLYPSLTDEEMEFIAQEIRNFFQKNEQ